MPVTSNDIANQAVQYIGDNQPPVQGQAPTFDSSTAGIALATFYTPVVQTVAKNHGWDFARRSVALVPSVNVAPFPMGYTSEYLYPGNGVEIWQLMPAVIADLNNPLPIDFDIGNTLVAGVQTKVIWASLAAAVAIYNNVPSEATWDANFREAVVRLLASVLGLAVAGRPDSAQMMLEGASVFEGAAMQRGG